MRIGALIGNRRGARTNWFASSGRRTACSTATSCRLPKPLLAGQLGGIDRDSYRAMFSLDDDTLEAGGESILASKGDLGELLFSASAGLADLSRTLADLRGGGRRLLSLSRARSGELANLKARLAELKEDARADRHRGDAAMRSSSTRAIVRCASTMRRSPRARPIAVADRRHPTPHQRAAATGRAARRAGTAATVGRSARRPRWNGTRLCRSCRDEAITLSARAEAIEREIERNPAELDAIVVDETALQPCRPG